MNGKGHWTAIQINSSVSVLVGLEKGFRIWFQYTQQCYSAACDLTSAEENSMFVPEYLLKVWAGKGSRAFRKRVNLEPAIGLFRFNPKASYPPASGI